MSSRIDGKDRFVDFDLAFTRVGENNPYSLAVKKDLNAINQSLTNLILTRKGEKGFSPLFGTNVVSLLFETIGSLQEITLKEEIRFAIKTFEPRVEFIDVEFDDSDIDTNQVKIRINFRLVNEQSQRELVVEVQRRR